MYKNKSNPGTQGNASLELSKIVEDTDIFNSELLYRLTKFPEYKLKSKEIKVSSLNPSSLAYTIYGDQKFSWILIIFNPQLSHLQYSLGDVVRYPELTDLLNHIKV